MLNEGHKNSLDFNAVYWIISGNIYYEPFKILWNKSNLKTNYVIKESFRRTCDKINS